jgi:hypothetical protein
MKIEGFSMLRGVGDGEPIASDIFEVGGHEWVSNPPLEAAPAPELFAEFYSLWGARGDS